MGAAERAAPVDISGPPGRRNSDVSRLSDQNGQTDRSGFHDDAPPFDSDHRPTPSGHWDDSDNHGHWPPFSFGDNDKQQPGNSDTFVRPMENARDGPVLILELCPNGSLKNFLRKQYPEYYYNHVSDEGHLLPFSDQDFLIKQNLMMTRAQPNHHTVYSSDLTTLSTRELLSYCYQVARGLEYIAAQGVVHRDVAARNVLLSSRCVVKLADFAMAQHCPREGAVSIADFGGPMPIKWMAPEAILQMQISEKTDVWAFSILMCEIFTFAQEPYPNVHVKGNVMHFVEKVKEGLRMARPVYFPTEIFDKVAAKCWELDPTKRPSFSEIRRLLESFVPFSEQAEYLDLNQEYESFNQMFGITNTNVYVDLKYEIIKYEAVPKY